MIGYNCRRSNPPAVLEALIKRKPDLLIGRRDNFYEWGIQNQDKAGVFKSSDSKEETAFDN